MSKIAQTFEKLKEKGRAALIPFIMAGDPGLESTGTLVLEMAERGADLVEIGVPFSDPVSDGPTLQAASQRALRKGVNLDKIFSLCLGFKVIDIPILLMTYFNPVCRYELESFARRCKECRIDGVIIPDLPPEEADPWVKEARRADLDTVFMTAPTSPPERIRLIDHLSRGFIYHVSLTGVTGARIELPEGLEKDVRRIKEESKKPVAVGFGVSRPEQAKEISRFADGMVVGSALAQIMAESANSKDGIARVGNFVFSLSSALRS